MSTNYRRAETFAGNLWFTAVVPLREELGLSPDPANTIHLTVNLSDKEDIVADANYLIPHGQQKELDCVLTVTDFEPQEFKDIKTLKGLDTFLESFLVNVQGTMEDERRASMYIDLMFHLQEAFLRIKKTPTKENLREYTRKVFAALQEVAPVAIFIAFGDTIPEDSGLTPGWAFVDFVNEELINE